MAQRSRLQRYYILDTIVPFEEDGEHEFKGHKNLCGEEIPSWATGDSGRRSRQPVSRAINGILNTGREGTIYLGITDDGRVMGLPLTQYQKDHLVASLDDLLSRYNPPVEAHRFSIKFIPVVQKNSPDDDLLKIASHDSSKTVDEKSRMREHILRTNNFCWCDKDCVARKNCSFITGLYIVEIMCKAWKPADERNKSAVGHMKTYPLHEDETGVVYIRRQASTTQYTVQELHAMSKQIVDQHYQPQLDRLRNELHTLRSLASSKTETKDS